MLKQLYLDFSIAGWIFFLLFWVLIATAVFYYSRTLPPLSRPRRIFLTTIRALILVILFFIFFQPIVQLVFEKREKPAAAFLFDDSRSMQIEDRTGQRGDSLQIILNNLRTSAIRDSVNLKFYRFSQDLEPLQNDTLSFEGGQTNISLAVRTVMDSLIRYNIRNVVLLSDGQFNEGENPMNPVEDSPVPLYTVIVGDTVPQKDLQIVNVNASPVVYAGDTTTVSASLLHTGYDGQEVIVTLRQGSRQVGARNVTLPRSGFQTEVSFEITPQVPGELHYTVESEVLPDESSVRNNQKHFLLNVLRSKLRLMVISGQPSLDQRMLLFSLHQIPDITYSVFTEKNGAEFYEPGFRQVSLDSQDLFLFLGYPDRQSRPDILDRLFAAIRSGRKPLFLAINANTDLNKLTPVMDIVPISRDSRLVPTEQVIASLTGQGLLHPVTRVDDNPQVTMTMWKNLPPVTSYGRDLVLDKSASVLVSSQTGEGLASGPLLAVAFRNEIKTLVLAAAGFGAWHFQLQDDPSRDMFFGQLIENSVRWLINREDIRKVQIAASRKVVKMGESVEFSGQVFDDFYRPVEDATVKISISGDEFELKDVLTGRDGYYFFRTAGFPDGTYDYEITASAGDRFLGKSTGRFIVEPLELEMQNTAANPELLRQMAARAGGRAWRAGEFLRNLQVLHEREQIQQVTLEYVLWNKIYWLILLIALFSLEWFFRKRWSLL